jgi:murein DD-endopeptidase MepM/ murein hydrolase activator NlpD
MLLRATSGMVRDDRGFALVAIVLGGALGALAATMVWDWYERSYQKGGSTLVAMTPGSMPATDPRSPSSIQRSSNGDLLLHTPLQYSRVSSHFDPGRMHPVHGNVRAHNGTDFAAPYGTPIWSAAEGRVIFVGNRGEAGQTVIVDHGGGFTTMYGHMSAFANGLKVGDRVSSRQVLGYVGSTGVSTGPHLHFAVKYFDEYIDFLKLRLANI